MYCYRSDQGDCCIVGFYDPSGQWVAESDHVEIRSAAARVHYLNGGVDAELIGELVAHVCRLLVDINNSIKE
jgi:hypothetical protein